MSERVAFALQVRRENVVATPPARVGTLTEVAGGGRVDVAGVSDGSEVANVFHSGAATRSR